MPGVRAPCRRLHADVVARYSVPAVVPQWRAVLDELTLVGSPPP